MSFFRLFIYREICKLYEYNNKCFSTLEESIKNNLNDTLTSVNESLNTCVGKIKSINSDNLHQMKKINSDNVQQMQRINMLNNQPITKKTNHYTETDSISANEQMKYISDTKETVLNDNSLYMSPEDKIVKKIKPSNQTNHITRLALVTSAPQNTLRA